MDNASVDYVRIRTANVPLIPGSIVVTETEPWARPWAWARAIAPEVTARGVPWRDLNDAEQSEAVRRAVLRWHQLPGSARKVSALDVAPHLAAEFVANEDHPGLRLDRLPPGSRDLCAWRCERGHTWSTRVLERTKTNGTGCPVCSVAARTALARERAVARPGQSLADRRPELADEFVACLERPELSKHMMKPAAVLLCLWRCAAGHEWQAHANNRSKPNGTGCPECADADRWRRRGVAVAGKALADVRPEIAAEFVICIDHPELSADTLRPGSKFTCRWRCGKCSHVWEATPHDRKQPWCRTCNSKKGWERRRQGSCAAETR